MIYLLIPSSGTMPASAGTATCVTSGIGRKGNSRTAADRCAGEHIAVEYRRTARRGNARLERCGAACGDDERR